MTKRKTFKNLNKKVLTFIGLWCNIQKSVTKATDKWDHSSAGRASALQAEGHRFEPYWSHHKENIRHGEIAQLARAYGSYP